MRLDHHDVKKSLAPLCFIVLFRATELQECGYPTERHLRICDVLYVMNCFLFVSVHYPPLYFCVGHGLMIPPSPTP